MTPHDWRQFSRRIILTVIVVWLMATLLCTSALFLLVRPGNAGQGGGAPCEETPTMESATWTPNP